MPSLRRWTRRLRRAAALAGVFLVTSSMAPVAAEPAGQPPLARLRAGNERFVKGARTPATDAASRQALTSGERPFAMVLSCADSRVPPEYVFDAALGELFVVRSAGGVTDHAVLASLEYASKHLGTPLLVVMGHESCEVVKSAAENPHGGGPNLDYLVSHIRAGAPAGHAPADLRDAVLANVEQVINDVVAGSDLLKAGVTGGTLQVVGAYYELSSGRVLFSAPVGAPTNHE